MLDSGSIVEVAYVNVNKASTVFHMRNLETTLVSRELHSIG